MWMIYVDLPKVPKQLPRFVLTSSETEQVLSMISPDSMIGLRNRTILETFYSTGIRRRELARLCVQDIDHERGMIIIRQGKGKKDRVIPIGERALAWVRRYLDEYRPKVVIEPDTGVLFLTLRGKAFNPGQLTAMAGRYVRKSEIEKKGACHLFRHTMATLMLECGADIRYIQRMLGHKQLNTTDIYTHVSDKKLKEVHTATHPGAALKRRRSKKIKGKKECAESGGPSKANDEV